MGLLCLCDCLPERQRAREETGATSVLTAEAERLGQCDAFYSTSFGVCLSSCRCYLFGKSLLSAHPVPGSILSVTDTAENKRTKK